ncbi:hypothetical protein OG713_01250 [Streptomyces sp. NBC_00723]
MSFEDRVPLLGDRVEHGASLLGGEGALPAFRGDAGDVVHDDRGHRLDTPVDLRRAEGEAAAAADADDADAVPVHEVTRTQVVDGRAEVLGEDVGRGARTVGTKILHHPVVGELVLDWDTLTANTDPDQHLTVWTAAPGSPTHERLRILASWQTEQHLAPSFPLR